jgi:hypothetical protein
MTPKREVGDELCLCCDLDIFPILNILSMKKPSIRFICKSDVLQYLIEGVYIS